MLYYLIATADFQEGGNHSQERHKGLDPAFGQQDPGAVAEVAEEEAALEQGVLSLAAAPSEYDLGTADLSAPGDFDESQECIDADQLADMSTPFVAEDPLSPPSSSK